MKIFLRKQRNIISKFLLNTFTKMQVFSSALALLGNRYLADVFAAAATCYSGSLVCSIAAPVSVIEVIRGMN